jgi:hypothetical protein
MNNGDTTGTPQAQPNVHDMLAQAHDSAKALFDQTGTAMRRMETIKGELTKLAKLGDTVTPEEVIESAGEIISKGVDPMEMANVLADMPQGGVALATWVQQHLQQQQQLAQALEQQHALARHEMGASALRMMAGHHGELAGAPPHAAFAPQAPAPASAAPSADDDSQASASANALGATSGSIH